MLSTLSPLLPEPKVFGLFFSKKVRHRSERFFDKMKKGERNERAGIQKDPALTRKLQTV